MKYIQKLWLLEFLGYSRYSNENKQRGKSKRKEVLIMRKIDEKIIQNVQEARKRSQEAKSRRG